MVADIVNDFYNFFIITRNKITYHKDEREKGHKWMTYRTGISQLRTTPAPFCVILCVHGMLSC